MASPSKSINNSGEWIFESPTSIGSRPHTSPIATPGSSPFLTPERSGRFGSIDDNDYLSVDTGIQQVSQNTFAEQVSLFNSPERNRNLDISLSPTPPRQRNLFGGRKKRALFASEQDNSHKKMKIVENDDKLEDLENDFEVLRQEEEKEVSANPRRIGITNLLQQQHREYPEDLLLVKSFIPQQTQVEKELPPTPQKQLSQRELNHPIRQKIEEVRGKLLVDGNFYGHKVICKIGQGNFMDVFLVQRSEETTLALDLPEQFVVKVLRRDRLKSTFCKGIQNNVKTAKTVYLQLKEANVPVAEIYNIDSIVEDGCFIGEYLPEKIQEVQKYWAENHIFNPLKELRGEELETFQAVTTLFAECFINNIIADLKEDNFRERTMTNEEGKIIKKEIVIVDTYGQDADEEEDTGFGYLDTCFKRFCYSEAKTFTEKVVKVLNEHVVDAIAQKVIAAGKKHIL